MFDGKKNPAFNGAQSSVIKQDFRCVMSGSYYKTIVEYPTPEYQLIKHI